MQGHWIETRTMLRFSGSGVETWNDTPSKSASVMSSRSRLPSLLNERTQET